MGGWVEGGGVQLQMSALDSEPFPGRQLYIPALVVGEKQTHKQTVEAALVFVRHTRPQLLLTAV